MPKQGSFTVLKNTQNGRAGAALKFMAGAAIAALALTGCASNGNGDTDSGDTTAPEANGSALEFNQELHDMLPDAIRESGEIAAAGAFANPPFLAADLNDATQPVGIAPDITDAMETILGVEFVWNNTQWPGQLPGLEAGTFDIVMGQVSVTAEREEGIIDLVSFFQDGLGFLVPVGNPEGISNWESVCGLKVGTSLGSLYVASMNYASEQHCEPAGLPPIEPAEYQDQAGYKSALLAGNIDATIDAFSGVLASAEADPEFLDAVRLPDEEAHEFEPGLRGIGVNKSNPGLTQALGEALQIIVDSGVYDEILANNGLDYGLPGEGFFGVNPLTGTEPGETVS